MALGFGLLSAQIPPAAPPDWRAAYAEVLDLTEHAERLGYSSVWTTEHHFVDDGYMPSLLVTSAAMAARTERIEIGTGVLLAPLHHPIRLAEDAATVQLLSGGRLTLGLGLGWNDAEFAALGVPRRCAAAAMSEVLDMLPEAWSGEPFTHSGDVYRVPDPGRPPDTPHPHPHRHRGRGGTGGAPRRTARRRLLLERTPHKFIEQVQWAHDEMEKTGRDPATFRWIYYSIMCPGDDADTAWSEYAEHVWALTWKYSDMEASAERAGPVATPPTPPADVVDKIRSRSVVLGSPQQIVERLNGIREEAGVPVEFMARSYFSTLEHHRQIELMEQLAADVLPHV